MAEVVYYVATSLDGYIATADGGVDWLMPFQASGLDYGYADFLRSVDGLVMGRRTYDQVQEFGDWPYTDKLCRVVTSRPLERAQQGVAVASGPEEAVKSLGVERVWLVGGTELLSGFRQAGLVSEYCVSVMPVVLGAGVPLFAPGPGASLSLRECRPYPDGVVQLRYGVQRG